MFLRDQIGHFILRILIYVPTAALSLLRLALVWVNLSLPHKMFQDPCLDH